MVRERSNLAKTLTRSAVLAAVLLTLAPGPALAFCLKDMPEGGCCPMDACNMPTWQDTPSCCAPVEPAPVPAAAGQGFRPVPSVLTVVADDVAPPGGSSTTFPRHDPDGPDPFQTSLYTLHAAFLI